MTIEICGEYFELAADKTGLPFISREIPTGSFNFIARRDQKYTIAEIIDIVNDALLLQNYILIKKETSFTIVPADREIDPHFVPYVASDQLQEHGKTEIVATFVKLQSLSANDLATIDRIAGPLMERLGYDRRTANL